MAVNKAPPSAAPQAGAPSVVQTARKARATHQPRADHDLTVQVMELRQMMLTTVIRPTMMRQYADRTSPWRRLLSLLSLLSWQVRSAHSVIFCARCRRRQQFVPSRAKRTGSCRMGPHGAAGRVLERRSLPPGEMFSPLYGTGCTTLCAMSAPVQEKQTALSQLPARLLPPAVRASPAPCVPKSICWRRRHMSLMAHTALQQGQVDWV